MVADLVVLELNIIQKRWKNKQIPKLKEKIAIAKQAGFHYLWVWGALMAL